MEKRFEWLWTQLEKLAKDDPLATRDVVGLGIKLATAEAEWRASQPLRAD